MDSLGETLGARKESRHALVRWLPRSRFRGGKTGEQAPRPRSFSGSAWLRARREELGLSRRGIAELVHVREETVEAWESAANRPQRRWHEPLARSLECSVADVESAFGYGPRGDSKGQVVQLRAREEEPSADGLGAEDVGFSRSDAQDRFVRICLDRWHGSDDVPDEVLVLVARYLFSGLGPCNP